MNQVQVPLMAGKCHSDPHHAVGVILPCGPYTAAEVVLPFAYSTEVSPLLSFELL